MAFSKKHPVLIIAVIFFVLVAIFFSKTNNASNVPLTMSSVRFVKSDDALAPVKTREEIFGINSTYTEEDRLKDICTNFEACDKPDPWTQLYEEQINKYGDLAKRFLFSNEINWVESLDYDGDGHNEIAVALCGVWGNECPHQIVIIKNNVIIAHSQ